MARNTYQNLSISSPTEDQCLLLFTGTNKILAQKLAARKLGQVNSGSYAIGLISRAASCHQAV